MAASGKQMRNNYTPCFNRIDLFIINSYIKLWFFQAYVLNKCCKLNETWKKCQIILWNVVLIQFFITNAELFLNKLWTTNPKSVMVFLSQVEFRTINSCLDFFSNSLHLLETINKKISWSGNEKWIRSWKKISVLSPKSASFD